MEANPTLDQLQVFIAVVSEGGFSAASRVLNKAQSVVSYTISNLEAQLEVKLFEREGVRQPKLTEEGKAVLEEARRMVADLQSMRARVRGLKEGLEAEISVAVSTIIPDFIMVDVFKRFQEQFPSVSLRLNTGELGMVHNMVATGQATIGFGGSVMEFDDNVICTKIGNNIMLPMASPDHRLSKLNRKLTLADVRGEVQLVVTDSSGLTGSTMYNLLSYKMWRVSDIATKNSLIAGGLGWGGLPLAVARHGLERGLLKRLDIDVYEQIEFPIYTMHKTSMALGPAARWMADAFRQSLQGCPKVSGDYGRGEPQKLEAAE
jgi:DNA-binding transcriptional LysR family regulator